MGIAGAPVWECGGSVKVLLEWVVRTVSESYRGLEFSGSVNSKSRLSMTCHEPGSPPHSSHEPQTATRQRVRVATISGPICFCPSPSSIMGRASRVIVTTDLLFSTSMPLQFQRSFVVILAWLMR